jgi:hypothetical protein
MRQKMAIACFASLMELECLFADDPLTRWAGESVSLLLVNLFMVVCRGCRGLVLVHMFAGDAIFAFDPATEVHELTTFRTKGAKGIFFPFDRFTAGWTVHEG